MEDHFYKLRVLLPVRKTIATIFCALVAPYAVADADLYTRDTPSDTGIEPYAGPGPVYLSPDIWVRNEPDPSHEPYPFSPASPPWTPLPHQNPEYRDSKTGQPNYVYVRIHNRGDEASTGTERLRLYQAKASTGLVWPSSWVDNVAPACGADFLQGIEITKPRKNAQLADISELNAYRDALIDIQTDPQFQYSDGAQYWRKQNAIHATSGNPEHGNPAFLGWHREMLNRFEERLRESNPLVSLLYWDWTVDPRAGARNLFTTAFMGAGNGIVETPLTPLQPPTLQRDVGFTPANPSSSCNNPRDADSMINAITDFPTLGDDIESSPNHNCAHGYIGGNSGQISILSTAVNDPFFFLLHGNVDRLWANWQRNASEPQRIDPIAAYQADSSHSRINSSMSPWDGATGMAPWNGPAAYAKTAKHQSVVFPPIYDTAQLVIPILQPGESVVVEIPWYPPDVSSFNCSGNAGHFCLLTRIETSTTAPFGMSVPEAMNVGNNTANNNNISWKNLTIVDDVVEPSLRLISGSMVRNNMDREAVFEITLRDRTEKRQHLLLELAKVALAVPEEIAKRLSDKNRKIRDLEFDGDDGGKRILMRIVGKEPGFSVLLKAKESFPIGFVLDMGKEDVSRELLEEPFHFDIEQRLDPTDKRFDKDEYKKFSAGGVRFTVDFQQLEAQRKLQKGVVVKVGEQRLELLSLGRKSVVEKPLDAALVQHVSPGEPIEIRMRSNREESHRVKKMVLELDKQEIVVVEESDELSETISIDEPGVHTILVRTVEQDGEVSTKSVRILVSENIPPNAVISKPGIGDAFQVGDIMNVVAETSAAFGREVREVSLYVKKGDRIDTGLNLVAEKAYEPVSVSDGSSPHQLHFIPKESGMYMLQLGVIDDKGISGVSGHVMVTVTK